MFIAWIIGSVVWSINLGMAWEISTFDMYVLSRFLNVGDSDMVKVLGFS